MAQSNVFNCDCVEYMKTLPDNFFDLCIADPPYGDATKDKIGGGIFKEERKVRGEIQEILPTNWKRFSGGTWAERYRKPIMPTEGDSPDTPAWGGVEIPKWDVAPGEEYFKEMFRVSRNQIIWGGNYFSLPPTRCFLVWRKTNIAEDFTMAMAEYAWTSFNGNAKIFSCPSLRTEASGKFHPTEKRLELYRWIIERYAKPGYKIFDPNMGSQNSRIAAYLMDYDYWGCEIDKYYFDEGCKNFERVIHGKTQTTDGKTLQQMSLFD